MLTIAVGTVAGILTVAFGVPQAAKILRAKSADGVSQTAWWLTYVLCLTWLGYGLQIGDAVLVLTNGASLIAPAVILFAANREAILATLGRLALVTTVVLGVSLVVPQWLSGFIAAALLSTTRIPQVVASYRAWRDQIPTVVSAATWTISLTFSGLWVLYGALNADPAQIIGNVVATALSLLVLVFEISGSRRVSRG